MASKVYIVEETPTVWSDTTGDLALTLNGLATQSGRIGAQLDLGSASRAYHYSWRFTCQFDTAPNITGSVEIYLAWSDGTRPDGEVGASDAALSPITKRSNLKLIGILVPHVSTADIDFTCSGICQIPTRYVSPVIFNNTDDSLQATNNTGEFTLTPTPFESQ